MKINMQLDLSGSKNMACGEPLCNKKIQVLDMKLVGTRMFVYRYCNPHWKLHLQNKCESDLVINKREDRVT